jgi:hypothetical protein
MYNECEDKITIEYLKVYTNNKILLCNDIESSEVRTKNISYSFIKPVDFSFTIESSNKDHKILVVNFPKNIKYLKNNNTYVLYFNRLYEDRKYYQYDKLYDLCLKLENLNLQYINNSTISKPNDKIIKTTNNEIVIIKQTKIRIVECDQYKNLKEINIKTKIFVSSKENWLKNLSYVLSENIFNNCLVISNCNNIDNDSFKYTKIMSYDSINDSSRYKKKWDLVVYDLFDIDTEKLNKIVTNEKIKKIKSKMVIYRIKNFGILKIDYMDFFKILFGSCFENYMNYYEGKYNELLNKLIIVDKTTAIIKPPNIIINRKIYENSEVEKYILNNNINAKILKHIDNIGVSFYNNNNDKIKCDELQECTICTNILDKSKMCTTLCNHVFCYSCIILNYINKNKCPNCRNEYVLHNLLPQTQNKYAKFELLKNDMKENINKYKKIMIYAETTIISFLKDLLYNNYKNLNIITLTKNKQEKIKKILEINNYDNFILFVESCDSIYSKYVRELDKIIILDREYDYILKKESIGYDFMNKIKGIILDIYEEKR